MSKTLVLARHAHRDTGHGRDHDNGLSQVGRKQAEALATYWLPRLEAGLVFISSPKVRCVETLEPFARRITDGEILRSDLLDEGGDVAFKAARFLKWWVNDAHAPVVIACSHGDWIPCFLQLAVGSELFLEKGGCAELVLLGEKKIILRGLLQDLTGLPGR